MLTCICSQLTFAMESPKHCIHSLPAACCEHCRTETTSPLVVTGRARHTHSTALCRSVKEQHRRLSRVRLQPERHHPGLQRTLPFPGEPSLHLAANAQPHPQLPGG